MIKVTGKGNISATIIADSISEQGKRITTYELEYHRYIHSEFMTHRLFSRNAASSRAIPVEKMLESVRSNPAIPTHWGKNQAGMQAKEQLDGVPLCGAVVEWQCASDFACSAVEELSKIGLHKQVANRLTEPFQMMKVVCTATEYDNFFYLRNHPDAQPEIAELARCMWEALQQSTPEVLKAGEWHTPYVGHYRYEDGLRYGVEDEEGQMFFCTLEDALKISSSCCAQVSFRKSDDSLEKATAIYDRLVSSKPVHASPFEHQATPMEFHSWLDLENGWNEEGITHMDSKGDLWSGNFKGFIQHRQLIPDNACWEYKA
jgi:thymidylate synthase ThyX